MATIRADLLIISAAPGNFCLIDGRLLSREPPVYGCEAFVHKMEGKNLRTWVKVSPNKLVIHIYYDSMRKCHRVICVDGSMVVIHTVQYCRDHGIMSLIE